MYKNAKENNSDIVICDMVDCYEDGHKIFHNCTIYDWVYKVTPSASNKIFKKDFIKNICFLNDKWYEDFNFTTKLLLKEPKISTVSDPFYNCNVRNLSTMNNNNSEKNLDIIYVIEDLIEYSKENNLYNENIFKYLIFDHILITTINRVACQKNKEKKKVLKQLKQYCNENLKKYKKQVFYKKIPIKRKIIAELNYYGLHNVSKLLLKMKSIFKREKKNAKSKCNSTSL